MIKGLAATTGTHTTMDAVILPGVCTGCMDPGLVMSPMEGSCLGTQDTYGAAADVYQCQRLQTAQAPRCAAMYG